MALKFRLLILLLLLPLSLWSNNVPLLKVIEDTKSDIRWNPYRERGLIIKDDVTLSFMLSSTELLVNSDRIVPGITFNRVNGEVFVNAESAALLYRLLKMSDRHEDVINDQNLFNIPVIILDPGHGGKDPGALGVHPSLDIKEKDIVLDISKEVAKRLKKKYSHKKIILTRDEDKFLTLEERVEMANHIELGKKQAVIYISIHANASLNRKATGFEVWYLPKGYRRNVLNSDIKNNQKLTTIVNALKEDEISLEGEELAKSILDGMSDQIEYISPNRGLKEEIWFVVRNARMASVLIEVGFVTNDLEGERLKDPLYLQKLADGIYNGITNFVSSYESVGR